jgi:hypothetical protein
MYPGHAHQGRQPKLLSSPNRSSLQDRRQCCNNVLPSVRAFVATKTPKHEAARSTSLCGFVFWCLRGEPDRKASESWKRAKYNSRAGLLIAGRTAGGTVGPGSEQLADFRLKVFTSQAGRADHALLVNQHRMRDCVHAVQSSDDVRPS